MHLKIIKKIIIYSTTVLSLQFINSSTNLIKAKKVRVKAINPSKTQTLTLTLKNRNQGQLGHFIYNTVTPGKSEYRKYMSPRQFGNKYGLSNKKIKVIGKYMHKYHLKTYTYPGNIIMTVKGSTKNVNKAFHVKLFRTEKKTNNYQNKVGKVKLPKNVDKNITFIDGFAKLIGSHGNSVPTYPLIKTNVVRNKNQDPNISDGSYQKFGRNYNTASLYNKNNGGQGQTIGIISLSQFKMNDVKTYLKKEQVNSNPNRIKKVTIDNSGLINNQLEPTMDVEQASAMAPKSKVNAYVGGNMIADYATAIGRDNVDVLSSSFGSFEKDLSRNNGFAKTINLLLKQAAAQGITSFNASGDNGPYAFQEGSSKKTQYFPATSPYVTATGGTTLPFKNYPFSAYYGSKVRNDKLVSLNQEKAWSFTTMPELYGSKYIKDTYNQIYSNLLNEIKNKKLENGIKRLFTPTKKSTLVQLYASGGGFSTIFGLPDYQKGISGTQTYNAKQLVNLKKAQLQLNSQMTSGKQNGRNVPDISADADPLTGYDVYLNGKMIPNGGGTSIVSPQIAGMAAVINSANGKRMGFWNPQIYKFAKEESSPFTPLNSLDNDNLYYLGQPGKIYNQATGLGTVDFTKLNQSFENQK